MNGDIAIIGMGCRYPGGVADIESFWELLKTQKGPISDIPIERWNNLLFFDENRQTPGKYYAREDGYLSDIHCFDADFFKILPHEASHIDPKQRLLLETSYHALQNSRIGMRKIKGTNTGVYVGAYINDSQHLDPSNIKNIDACSDTGSAMSISANRLSHFYNLRGPSLAVDTACSSSLVAVHLACQALRDGTTDMGIAAGVNVILKPEMTISMSKANILSIDGHDESFDDSSNGFSRSEGVGVVILKRLTDALIDDDYIHGVIKSSRVNSDGNTKRFSVPNGNAQEELFKDVLSDSRIEEFDIDYVEAHSTGIPEGDSIELNAIANVIGRAHDKTKPLHVGSVKSNIGNTGSASGIAGIIKTCLCIENGTIVPNFQFNSLNPTMRFEKNNMKINSELGKWPKSNKKRALVNSFGIGGTNASVIIEEAPIDIAVMSNQKTSYLALLSAQNKTVLKKHLENVNNKISKYDDNALVCRDVAWNLACLANDCVEREAFVFRSIEELKSEIEKSIKHTTSNNNHKDEAVDLCCVFSGTGSQWPTMAQKLLKEISFTFYVKETCKVFKLMFGLNIWSEFLRDKDENRIDDSFIAQPAMFALQVALFKWMQEIGFQPKFILGHGIGEIAAAHCAGILSLQDAVKVIYHRSRILQTIAGKGRLLAVGLNYEECNALVGDMSDVEVAAINSPSSVTLASSSSKLNKIKETLDENNVFTRFVRDEESYHSRDMECLKDEFLRSIKDIKPRKEKTRLVSSITANEESYLLYDSDYWWRNMRDSVKFKDAIYHVLDSNVTSFVEVGGHPILSSSIDECCASNNITGLCIPTLTRNKNDYYSFLECIAKLYKIGIDLDFKSLMPKGDYIELPSYPFQKTKYWHDRYRNNGLIDYFSSNVNDEVLGSKVASHFDTWRCYIDVKVDKYLDDHKIKDSTVYPCSGYLNLMLHACQFVTNTDSVTLYNVNFKKMLTLEDTMAVELKVCVDNKQHITISNSEQDRDWQDNTTAIYSNHKTIKHQLPYKSVASKEYRRTFSKEFIYLIFENIGLNYGDSFRGIKNIKAGDGISLAEIEVPEAIRDQTKYVFHPALLDCVLHSIYVALNIENKESHRFDEIHLPVSIGEFDFYDSPKTDEIYCFTIITNKSLDSFTGDVYVYDSNKTIIARISNITYSILNKRIEDQLTEQQSKMTYQHTWKETEARIKAVECENILVFARHNKLVDRVLNKLAEHDGNIITIRPVNEKNMHRANYYLDQKNNHLHKDLIEILNANKIDCIIDLWTLIENQNDINIDEFLESEQYYGYASLLNCVKATSSDKIMVQPNILAITNGVYKVINKDPINLVHSTIVGLLSLARNQEPGLALCHIDLSMDVTNNDINALAEHVFTSSLKNEVTVRNEKLYAHRF